MSNFFKKKKILHFNFARNHCICRFKGETNQVATILLGSILLKTKLRQNAKLLSRFNLSPPSTDGGQKLAVKEEAWHAFPLLAFPLVSPRLWIIIWPFQTQSWEDKFSTDWYCSRMSWGLLAVYCFLWVPLLRCLTSSPPWATCISWSLFLVMIEDSCFSQQVLLLTSRSFLESI